MHEFVVEVCVVDCEDGIDVVVALVTSKCPRTCRARHEIIQEGGTENSLSHDRCDLCDRLEKHLERSPALQRVPQPSKVTR